MTEARSPFGAERSARRADRPAGLGADALRLLLRRPAALACAVVIVAVTAVGFFPWLFTDVDPRVCRIAKVRAPAEPGHPFGFSPDGCDYLAQTVYGAGPSIKLSLIVVTGTLLVGGLLGVTAGYYGGWLDAVFSRGVDAVNSIPFLLGALLVLSLFRDVEVPWFGADFAAIAPAAVTLILFGWTSTMRLVRASVLEARGLDYVQAARSLGASGVRIMFRHILPNAAAPVLSLVPLSIAGMISAEAALSFLGIGVRPPAISWGIMISDAGDFFVTDPMLLVIPSGCLVATVLAFVVLGDAVRDALDPKSR